MTGMLEDEATSASTTARDPWLGSVVGDRYRIEEWIGQGGMGVVYRGQHLELGKRVAIKRLDPHIASDPISFERFRREAIAASRIESPHVVHVFDWGMATDGSPYLVMELLEGNDLRQLLQREGRLLPEAAGAIIGQVLRALVRTHRAQIIHRDLKPENVFLCRYDADELYVKLLDFGISKRTSDEAHQDSVTRRGVILGTASYMSPEQARGEAKLDARSDLYSVGAILFEALTGRVPHRARTYEGTLVDICTRDADDVRLHAPLVPEAVAHVVTRALQRDVTQRFLSATEFLEALAAAVPDIGRRILEHPMGPDRTPSVALLPSESRKRPHLRPKVIGAIALLCAVGAAVYWLTGSAIAPSANTLLPVTTNIAFAAERAAPAAAAAAAASTAAASLTTNAPVQANAPGSKPASGSVGGSNSAKTAPARQTNTATTGPTDKPGVASGLELRRTMP